MFVSTLHINTKWMSTKPHREMDQILENYIMRYFWPPQIYRRTFDPGTDSHGGRNAIRTSEGVHVIYNIFIIVILCVMSVICVIVININQSNLLL